MRLLTSVRDIKPYTLKEIAEVYGVCDKTVKRWIEPFKDEIGQRRGRFYNVTQVKIIFERLGLPGTLDEFIT